jgi:hypothetical protein
MSSTQNETTQNTQQPERIIGDDEIPITKVELCYIIDTIENYIAYYNDSFQAHGRKHKNYNLIYLQLQDFEKELELADMRYNNADNEDDEFDDLEFEPYFKFNELYNSIRSFKKDIKQKMTKSK